MNGDEDDMIKMLHNFFYRIAERIFATHPNYRECEDPTCSPVINKGITIKYDANMHYATTALSSAVFQDLCKQAELAPFTDPDRNEMGKSGNFLVGLCTLLERVVEQKISYNLIRFFSCFWKHPTKKYG